MNTKERIYIKDLHEHLGGDVTLAGWVDARRDHGKLIFLDLRDVSGIVQMVALPSHAEAHALADKIRDEWVVSIRGKVNKRPEKMINPDLPFGDIEIEILNIEILNESDTPPLDIHTDGRDIGEEVRLQYRYLDLRRSRMQKNLRTRSEFVRACREFLFKKNFTEIETPLLTASTAEGSRDFVVPSRIHQGKFYALPQSPQQYKQLLMVAGFERYFQLARAIRDEDLRADRGFEHTQIDIEMSFVKQEDIMRLIEEMMIAVAEGIGFMIRDKPFPRVSYADAMKTYGADKFDMRNEEEKRRGVLAYAWVTDFPQFENTDGGGWTFSHNPFSMPKPEFLEDLMSGKNIGNIISQQYDLVCNGYEAGGGSIRAHKPEILKAIYKIMGYDEARIESSVGHMLKAFKYGVPPHGGIALGVERTIMNFTREEYLREVQAFPMTRGGKTAVMDGPSRLSPEQLVELGIKTSAK